MLLSCFKDYMNIIYPINKPYDSEITEDSNFIQCRKDNMFNQWIPVNKWCIYERTFLRVPMYCQYGEHLKDCKLHHCKEGFKCKRSYCILVSYICDGIWDCPMGHDENITFCQSCNGKFHCRHQSICIFLSQVCDGVNHCIFGNDEESCGKPPFCPDGCMCTKFGIFCSQNSLYLVNPLKKLHLSYQNRINFCFNGCH